MGHVACQPRHRALHTTSDFPIILGNTVGRVLRDAYHAAPSDCSRLGTCRRIDTLWAPILPSASLQCRRALASQSSRQGCSGCVLAFAVRHVGDFGGREGGPASRHAPQFTSWGLQPKWSALLATSRAQHDVDLDLGGDEGVQRGAIDLGHCRPRVGFEGITALFCLRVKFNRTRNVPRTSTPSRVASGLHGRNRNGCKRLESRGKMLCGVATQKSLLWDARHCPQLLISCFDIWCGAGFEPAALRL
jgi:hypothetical protein